MTLTTWDWLVIVGYFVTSAVIGRSFMRRRGWSLVDYLSGRSLPWWIAGTSMVAASFGADAPLAVAGLVSKYGVAGNWLWWNGAISGVLTVFFFARLWRRAGVTTDVEFAELRYGGRPAAILRAFRALYLALPINLIIMAWVTRAMVTILEITLGLDPWVAAVGLMTLTGLYLSLAGLRGVIASDTVQLVVGLGGSILLALLAVNSVGGLNALTQGASAHFGSRATAFNALPPIDKDWLPLSTLMVFLTVQWWAAWYPGAEPGGGGIVARRILSTRTERDGVFATLWFNIAHYALRPWPWILVGFVALLRYPDLGSPEEGYVRVMIDVLPSPLRGLLLASFAAAFVSTISTHLSWGASYLVNDVYLRFFRPSAAAGQQVRMFRYFSALLMALTLVTLQFIPSVEEGWKLLIGLGAGTGAVFILRWYWWRVNAWSEISAMIAAFVTSLFLHFVELDITDTTSPHYAIGMLITTGVTTLVWLTMTFLTPAESEATLIRFYRRARPGGAGWRHLAKWAGYKEDEIPGGKASWLNWIAGVVGVYSTSFAIGAYLLRTPVRGGLYTALAIFCFTLIYRNLGQDSQLLSSVDTPRDLS